MISHCIIVQVVSSLVQSVRSMGDKIFLTSNVVLNKTATIPTHSLEGCASSGGGYNS